LRSLSLTTVGAVCAVLTPLSFVAGGVLMAVGGVDTLIPETGPEGLAWVADVQAASDLFFAGAWLVILVGILGLVAFVGVYEALREAGPVLILAPIAGAVGMTLVTLSHLVPIALAYELAPGYAEAGETTRAALGVTLDTFASTSLLTNYVGNALVWGLTVPLFAVAILKTSVVPRWIGWVGLVAAVFAGWLGLFGPASGVIEGISTIGFLAFFVFMLSLGTALLLRRRRA
jgi:hypothetical protein